MTGTLHSANVIAKLPRWAAKHRFAAVFKLENDAGIMPVPKSYAAMFTGIGFLPA
jgi:hypothetical protein